MGGAIGIAHESPPPAQVILPVVQTPIIMQLTEVERENEEAMNGQETSNRIPVAKVEYKL